MKNYGSSTEKFSLAIAALFALSAPLIFGSSNSFAQEENVTNANKTADANLPPGRTVPLTTNESLLLGDVLKTQENITGVPEAMNILNRSNITVTVGGNITTTTNPPSPPPAGPVPPVVHLRIQIKEIQIFRDHDTSIFTEDGEWHLYGTVGCCGGAVNSAMPTRLFSFNAPGVEKEGEIDTPDNEMNDVTGTHRGAWGDVEVIRFEDVKQDFDIDNTNPLSEIDINFFGREDDAVSTSDFPAIPDIPETTYDEYARALRDVIISLNNMQGTQHLGNVHLMFNKANNYGLNQGSNVAIGYASSDQIYDNFWWKSRQLEDLCNSGNHPCTNDDMQDWPDFPDYIIAYTITDREGYRCGTTLGMNYNYTSGECTGDIFL